MKLLPCLGAVAVLLTLLLPLGAWADDATGTIAIDLTYYRWCQALDVLTPGMPRLEAEKVIAGLRKKPSGYGLHDMDVEEVVVYALDPTYVLIVWYRPGTEAMGTPQRIIPPVDGVYLKHRISRLR